MCKRWLDTPFISLKSLTNLLKSPVMRALIEGSFVLVSTGIFMEHLPPSKQTIARALKTYTFSSVIGLMLNLKKFIENKVYDMQYFIKITNVAI